ncbi:MAG: hypothetical protein IPP66_17650 [Anaerolineales bacterium]|nr:hypothetical protein [Anaerolineales bacterium]
MKSHHAKNKSNQKLHEICRIVFKVAIINFVVFVVVALMLGGDAINGDAINGSGIAGHYFVAMNGRSTEVSYPVYIYSKTHVISMFITHPLAMIAGIVYSVTGGKKEDFWKPKSTKKIRKQVL